MSSPSSADNQVLIDLAQRMGIPAVDAVRRVVSQLTSRELATASPAAAEDGEPEVGARPAHPRRSVSGAEDPVVAPSGSTSS